MKSGFVRARALQSVAFAVAFATFTSGAHAQFGPPGPPIPSKSPMATSIVFPKPGANPRVERLLQQMTLEEKMGFMYGSTGFFAGQGGNDNGQAGTLPGVERLGIPKVRLSDGPAGIRHAGTATAFPAPVGMTASFNPELSWQLGQAMAMEGRERGMHVQLAPMTNLVRQPQAGRNFETFGEDPFLAGRMVGRQVNGLQSGGMIATVKHYALNNQENNRQRVDVVADQRTMREIELVPFHEAVKEGAGSFMCAYNRVNGDYACENAFLLNQVLRKEWQYDGFVMSDWGAMHSSAYAIRAGADMEMPNNAFFKNIPEDIRTGRLSVADIDQSVRRILLQLDKIGMLPGSKPHVPPKVDARRIAYDIAVQGSVLMRNQNALLPLKAADLSSLVVLGPSAMDPMIGGGGSSRVNATRTVSFLDELRKRGAANLVFQKGTDIDGYPVPASALGGGLTASSAAKLDGSVQVARCETVTWTGTFTAPVAGRYNLLAQFSAPLPPPPGNTPDPNAPTRGSMRIEINGVTISPPPAASCGPFGAAPVPAGPPPVCGTPASNDPVAALFGIRDVRSTDGLVSQAGVLDAEAGKTYQIRITAAAGTEPMTARLAWRSEATARQAIDSAVEAARQAKTVILFVTSEGTEGVDKPDLHLSADQNALVDAVAAVNPRTIVMLQTGAQVLLPWNDKVGAILQTWFPGQEGAIAQADMVTGAATPSGRLPATWPRSAADLSIAGNAKRYPGTGEPPEQIYDEGIFWGYRWFDKQHIEPLYPFGYGLSYTSFAYSAPSATRTAKGYDIRFTVKNTGAARGTEVAQVYVGAPAGKPEGLEFAEKALAGFTRIELAPGESRTVSVPVDAQAFAYWSTAAAGWKTPGGNRDILIGGSSSSLPLKATVQVRAQ
jgi:beta-glucosidase